MRSIRTDAAVAATTIVAVLAAAAPAAANVDLGSYTIYPSDGGETAGTVMQGTETVETAYTLAGAPSTGEDGGSEICSPVMTRPHPTPTSPEDGRIYLEGEAHMECAGTPTEMAVDTFIGWIVTRNDGVTTGYHLQQGDGTFCSKRRRCPTTGELVARWGYETRCYSYGTYTAHVVVNYRYTYRGVRFSAQVEGPDISGKYLRNC